MSITNPHSRAHPALAPVIPIGFPTGPVAASLINGLGLNIDRSRSVVRVRSERAA